MKLLTVVVPAYQVQDTLSQTLDSLLVPQVLPYLEVLVVDDGSTDHTQEIARRYEGRYPGIFFCLHKENGGHGSTINLGLSRATGKYLKVLDGDDWFRGEGLLHLVAYLQKADQDVVLTPYETYHVQTGEQTTYAFPQVQYHRTYRVPEDPIVNERFALTTVCYRTAFLRSLSLTIQEHTFYVDEEFIGIPLLHVNTWVYLPDVLYVYRMGSSGQSVAIANRLKRLDHIQRVIQRLMEELAKCAPDHAHRTPMVDRLYRLATGYALLTLIYLPERKRGRALFQEMEQRIRQEKDLYGRCRKKFTLFRLLHSLGVGQRQYQWLQQRKGLQKYRQAQV